MTTLLTFKRPAVSVGLLLCTYGLEQWAQSQSSFFWVHSQLTNLLTAGVAAMAIVVHIKNGRQVFSTLPREFWLMALLITWSQLSVVWSVYPQAVFQVFWGGLSDFIPFALLLPLVVATLSDARQMFLSLLTIGAVICALLLITSHWSDRAVVFETGSLFGAKGFEKGNPLAIGNQGAYVAITALLLNFRGATRFWQVIRYAVVGAGIAVTVKSGSRGQTIGLGLGALVFLPYSRRFRDLVGFIGFAISVAIFGCLAFVLVDQLTRDASTAERSGRWTLDTFMATYQTSRVSTAAAVLSAYISGGPLVWLLGLGSSASFDPRILGVYPHMVPAEALAELGPVGLTLYLLMTIFSIQNLRECWQLVRDDPDARGIVATLGALVLFELSLTFKEGSLLGATSFFGMVSTLGHVTRSTREAAARNAELDAFGYAMNDEDLAREAADWDAMSGDDADRYAAAQAGHA